MIKQFGLTEDRALREIAEIVHDIDLKDNKFNRLEAVGVNATVTGLSGLLKDDRKLLQQCGVIFDGLYALLSGSDAGRERTGDDGKKQSSRQSTGGKRRTRAGRR